MILKRTVTFENPNHLKRCKIDSEIDYGSKEKGEIMVYRKRQRASVDQQPCKESEECISTSSSGSLTSKESQLTGSDGLKKSSRGRIRVVPSRFNDSIVDKWGNRRRKVDSMDPRKESSGGRTDNGSLKLNLGKGSKKLFPRKDNGDSSEIDFDDEWNNGKDASIRSLMLSSSDDANSLSVRGLCMGQTRNDVSLY